ncbi:MAG TPA: hypothetical protein VII99_04715, partial [Bacteroidia bacterium]
FQVLMYQEKIHFAVVNNQDLFKLKVFYHKIYPAKCKAISKMAVKAMPALSMISSVLFDLFMGDVVYNDI